MDVATFRKKVEEILVAEEDDEGYDCIPAKVKIALDDLFRSPEEMAEFIYTYNKDLGV